MNTSGTITKCVILARGLGIRMRRDDANTTLNAEQSAAAGAGLKAMIPVGRPFLDYVLSAVADAGFEQACLVIGPEPNAMREHYAKPPRPQRIQVSFAIQPEPIGTANAVLAAEEFAGPDEFLVINSDNYYPVEVLNEIQSLGQSGTVLFPAAALVRDSNIQQDRIHAFACCIVDQEGLLADIIEKPESAAADKLAGEKLVSLNCWRFGPDIFAACSHVPRSPRGEYELPSAVKLTIQRGMKFKVAISRAGVLDLSRRSDIAAVAERLKNVQARL